MSPASADIPIIDLSGPQAEVSKQLVDAAADHGFIYIQNLGHDIPAASIDDAFALMLTKVHQVRKAVQRTSRRKAGVLHPNQQSRMDKHARRDTGPPEPKGTHLPINPLHHLAMYAEHLLKTTRWETSKSEPPRIHNPPDRRPPRSNLNRRAFNFGEFINNKAQQPIPPTVAADEARFSAFADLCRTLCLRILALLGQGLQVNDFFSSAHFKSPAGSGTILRFLRYPPPSSTSHTVDDVRAGAHSDYGSITLLFRLRGQAGLEILKKDGTWAPVPVSPPGTENDPSPPILINIGDLLSYWTNGLFRSTVHRVVFPTNRAEGVEGESSTDPRYSIAFFCHPMDDVLLEPVPSERVRGFVEDGVVKNPYAERKVLTAGEHLLMRLRETYGTLYEDKKD
ncbi:isopenicillin N synthase-like protein [Metarhizium robertsii]|uniref:Oxoglutarate/iron-dependent oxygenase n=2 Tax=Metarhizium robertsii TaxID=568076 RepID=E9FA90_METRA|nr:Oxoglutarate/iron-dependent oxygenase [Metarhizium robertsii ARSEF 23]EFY95375.1 Oxoglutarate/iron-dependent oxygenase [Metarhizium robertsii ARSEF 23]EXU97402.1 isopenicillin N synthase-like protein [Metarhizium robertsii]